MIKKWMAECRERWIPFIIQWTLYILTYGIIFAFALAFFLAIESFT